jgi:peptide/nickel transport system substrate-binding protein
MLWTRGRLLVGAVIALGLVVAFVLIVRPRQEAPSDTLLLRLESFAIRLDPAFIADTQSRRIIDFLHAKLVRGSPDGRFEGEIAEAWEWAAPSILRVRLRSGLTFSDGKAVTAADAAFSLCRLLQPGAPYSWLVSNILHTTQANGPTLCPGLRTPDPVTLEIEVPSNPDRLLPALATASASIVPTGSAPGEYGVVPGAGAYVIEEILPGSQVTLRARQGGAMSPGASRVQFTLVQDDSTAAAMWRAGRLDVLEISNPTIYRLLVGSDGRLVLPGRLTDTEVHQIRLLIYNAAMIAQSLGLSREQAAEWVRLQQSRIDVDAVAQRFAPLLIPLRTSFFPARATERRSLRAPDPPPPARGQIVIITENDAFSDAIAAAVAGRIGDTTVTYLGMDKAVLISRLLARQYDIASITLEAVLDHPSYWLSFFSPGSPFNVFGTPIEGLSQADGPGAIRQDAQLIDQQGNWFVLAQERRLVALQPRVTGETFYPTGLINLATIRLRQ